VFAFNYATTLLDIKVAKTNISGLNIGLDAVAFGFAILRNKTSQLHLYW
jgi:type VI secretion system secreted protein VgrG